jgi:hypothetical protein
MTALDGLWVEAGILTVQEMLAFFGAFLIVIFVVWLLKSLLGGSNS